MQSIRYEPPTCDALGTLYELTRSENLGNIADALCVVNRRNSGDPNDNCIIGS